MTIMIVIVWTSRNGALVIMIAVGILYANECTGGDSVHVIKLLLIKSHVLKELERTGIFILHCECL